MAIDAVSGRIYHDVAIPGISDIATNTPPVNDPTGTQNFPSLTPAQSAANAKAAGAQSTSSTPNDPLTNAAGGALGKSEFLQLLVQEMTNQDPLQPADNTQFIAQLAQFSTLEQMQNLNTGFTSLQSTFQQTQARGLLNQDITAVDSSSGKQVKGAVDQIIINAGGSIQVDVNGVPVNLGDIISIGDGAPQSGSTSGAAPQALPGTLVPPPGSGQ